MHDQHITISNFLLKERQHPNHRTNHLFTENSYFQRKGHLTLLWMGEINDLLLFFP